ncbi:MAG: hypothetical protein IPH12_10220 [Saprospirales bacterium]|nr:hypothetical protein [Saprospirales bacterium]
MNKVLSMLLATAFAITAVSSQAQKMKIGDPTRNSGKVEWIPMQIETGRFRSAYRSNAGTK